MKTQIQTKEFNCSFCDKKLIFPKCQFIYGGSAVCPKHAKLADIILKRNHEKKTKYKNPYDMVTKTIEGIKLYESEKKNK